MEITFPAILDYHAYKCPEREAVIFEDARITFSQLCDRVNQRSNSLLHLGVKKGEHVATLSPNCLELVELILALWRIGAVFVPLNWRLSPDELRYILNQSDAETLMFSGAFEETVRKITHSINKVKKFLYTGEKCPSEYIDFEAETRRQSTRRPLIHVNEDDLAAIIYTSGTTGRPKGVAHTHKNFLWQCVFLTLETPELWKSLPKSLLAGPYFHVGGLLNFLWCLFNASPQVILKKFDPRDMLEWIEKEKVNRLHGVATLYNMIIQVPDIDHYDLSTVYHLGSGAEKIRDEVRNRLKELFPGAGIFEVYGMTESCGIITTRSVEYTEDKPSSVGVPPLMMEMRVVDEHGRDLAPGVVGEIIGRSPIIMKEYYNDPERTAEALRDGWLYTNDLGWLDEEGFLYIVERKNDMIITGGENIYPKEVEEVLYTHPKITEAAVFGLPDKIWGQNVCAAVVLEKGEEMSPEEIIGFCKENLASFKKPKSVFFLEALPRAASGKVQRYKLRKMLFQGQKGKGMEMTVMNSKKGE